MSTLSPVHVISANEAKAELHFAISGFWTCEAMQAFLHELRAAARPFWHSRTRFSALGDLRGFVPQDRATAEAIRESLLLAQKNGMERFAVVADSSLVKMQYRRITNGIEAEFFDTPSAAETWLRSFRPTN
ncbi:MAG: STAS/SEC14 domain-containing protein [Pseudomonadota bacterium]